MQPTVTYSDAMNVTPFAQTELYSVFEFVRAANCLRADDVLAFIGIKLKNLIQFDAAVFYLADLDRGVVIPSHVLGRMGDAIKEGVPLPLDQKLSGWVAANNQALRNLPPFPDFRNFHDPKPRFEISSIAPMNHRGVVVGVPGTVPGSKGELFRPGVSAPGDCCRTDRPRFESGSRTRGCRIRTLRRADRTAERLPDVPDVRSGRHRRATL